MGQIITVVSTQLLLAFLNGTNTYFVIMYVNGFLGLIGLVILWLLFVEEKLTITE